MKKDFCLFLKEEFALRQSSEPNYSIRAFAKSLEIDQSLLTKILNGKRKINEKTISRLAIPLALSPEEVSEFMGPAVYVAARRPSPANQLTEDDVNTMTDWHHFAILELLQVPGANDDLNVISKRLGLTFEEAEMAVDTLIQRGLVEENDGKFTVSATNNNWMNYHFTAPARKRLQKQFLEKAGKALHAVDISQRENTSLTIAVDRSKLNEFRQIIQTCKDSLRLLAEESGSYSDVYQLVVGFYPLTEMEEAKA